MAIKRMLARDFVAQLEAALKRKDGYIMCATGQDPKKWAKNSWWFTQYTSPRQHEKALYWREHAARVWDCNGLAEGLYKDFSGVDINTKARYNYANWCGTKGAGTIPSTRRVPGAAVFWGDTAGSIHHVAYLYKPVDADNPFGDWYLIEARGVMYGVVKTRLSERKPNFWGLMTKYFDYETVTVEPPKLGERVLRNGCEGEDVRELQRGLIQLGYSCGKWGADGDFGDATEQAVRVFQQMHGLPDDGIVGARTVEELERALAIANGAPEDEPHSVRIVGGNCYVRSAPNTRGEILGAAHEGSLLPWQGQTSEDGWLLVEYNGQNGWVSGKYGRLA